MARGDQLLVDLWGGVADRASGRRWSEDTLQLVFSGTKGVVAACILMLHERGLLDLDAAVAHYWPAFGKPEILVRDVVGHTARLPGIDEPLTIREFADRRSVVGRLEAQQPNDDPRAALCYHAFNYGWLCGELVRRTDGRGIGLFVEQEIARPLELELWIGLPEQLEHRVATLELADNWPTAPKNREDALAADPLLRSIWGNPMTFGRASFPWNSRDYRAAEIPGAGAIATARSIARMYASLGRLACARELGTGPHDDLAAGLTRPTARTCTSASASSCRRSACSSARCRVRSDTEGLVAPATAPGPSTASASRTP